MQDNKQLLPFQFFIFSVRNYLWAIAAALCILGGAGSYSATVMVKAPIQKFFLFALGSTSCVASLAVLHQFIKAESMFNTSEESAQMGWRELNVKAFAPTDQRVGDDGSGDEVEENYSDEWAEETIAIENLLIKRLLLAAGAYDIRCKYLGEEDLDDRFRIFVELPTGVTVRKLQGLAVDIASKAGIDGELEISAVPGGVAIDLLKEVESVDPTGDAIVRALADHGVKAKVIDVKDGLAFTRILLEPAKGVKVKDLISKAEDLMVSIGFSSEPIISSQPGAVAIDVPKENRVFANYHDYITDEKLDRIRIPIGVNQLTGELIWLYFDDSATCHGIISGMTGSGKSELTKTGPEYILTHYNPSLVQILAIDVKMSTFERFKGRDGIKVIENPVHGVVAIVRMVKHMQDRRKIRAGFKDVEEYNKQAEKPLPRILIYVEELKDLLDGLKLLSPAELEQLSAAVSEAFESEIQVGYSGKGVLKPKDVLMMALQRLGQAARSESINLFITTQEPDKALLDDLMGNLPAKISLRLRSYVESNVVLPGMDAHCERLLDKGDLLYARAGHRLERLQSLYLG